MAIDQSNILKLLVMRFPGHQSTDYSNFEEEIANGIFDYLEDIMEDRGDQLVKAFSEDEDTIKSKFRKVRQTSPRSSMTSSR
ncbi:hypothetical protein L596_010376 [Steinernema carpocapsae]|uniref:Uncharacterized protein n=1 Tax=Steinernema carpocapsae TaxID=34508 RepID=A0A4U5PI67_STECR|nr:hypothetical protein L596_010376 [Steinernema carpocapsae]